jgi:hypothetical protein
MTQNVLANIAILLSEFSLCRNPPGVIDVMLSGAKHLGFSMPYEAEILGPRLRMTLRHSLMVRESFQRSGCTPILTREYPTTSWQINLKVMWEMLMKRRGRS